MGEMDAYKDVFLSESADYIQQIVDGLLALESDPGDTESVETIFRGAHSLKGMAAAMGYERTAELTHKMEGLMDAVRKGGRRADQELVDLMLSAVDSMRALIEDESEERSDVDSGEIVSRLVSMTEASRREAQATAGEESRGENPAAGRDASGRRLSVKVRVSEDSVLKSVRAYMVLKRFSHLGEVLETRPDARDIEDERFDREFEVVLATRASVEDVRSSAMGVTEIESADIAEIEQAAGPGEAAAGPSRSKRKSIPKLSETQTVRVAIGHLDNMVNLVGELVILRSRLDRVAASVQSRDLDETLEELHRVSGELQHEVMQTRMVPVGNIFNRFPRMVRDLARDLGKEVAFEMEGLDIELDRTVLDEIGDPIVHLLRNTVDHGIEAPEEREATGKPRRGTVRLEACRERDHVLIAVSDDGRGMDLDRIWEKACSSRLVDPAQRDAFSRDEILLLTCAPGFSTAAVATKVSGRGVGMDVVKGKIEYLGGTLSIVSERGEGSRFELRLPLTLAIIHALMLGSGSDVYAMALSAVDEVLSPAETRVDTVEGVPVIVMRDGSVVPLYRLEGLLECTDDVFRPPDAEEHIVLVDAAGVPKGLVVERLAGRHEIVLKPLSRMFRDVKGIGGATVLGDGKVALVLDPRTLFAGREECA